LPHVHELTFLRRDRIDSAARHELFAPLLPHPQDISRNVANNAPLFLSPAWTDGRRSPESRIKILEDELEYLRHLKQRENVDAEAAASAIYTISRQICLDVLASQSQVRPNDSELIEVAQGKPFALSSSWGEFPKNGSVMQKEDFFFHTDIRADQSITVDLQRSYCVWAIRMRNRSDGFYGRANCLFYTLHELSDRMKSPTYPLNVDNEFLTGRSLDCHTTVPGLQGRHLTIFSTSITALHFSSLQVFTAFK
jgi:hypothetical protein